MTRQTTHRRSPLISMLIFAVCLAAGLLLIALLQLDIGAYKQQLAAHLERALNTSVRLGDAELSFHGGIALDIRNLQIGDNDNFSLHIPQLTAILQPLGLLRGEIIIEQILLDYPSLKFKLPIQLARSTLNLDRLGLKTLQIRKGSLTISYPKQESKPLRVENFNLVLHGLGKGLVSQLAATATLFQNNQNAELKAFLELTRQHSGQPWRQGNLRGDLALNNLQRNFLRHWGADKLPKQFNLVIGAEGIPAQNVQLTASINNSSSNKPVLSLASVWQSTETFDNFSNLKLGLIGVSLTGHLRLDRRNTESQLTGQIALGRTHLKTLLIGTDPLLEDLSGQLEKLEISIKGPLHATAENPLSPVQTVYLQVTDLSYPLGRTRLSDTSMILEMRNAQISLSEGRGRLARIPFRFSGTSSLLGNNLPEILFTLQSKIDPNQLQQELLLPALKNQKFSGEMPLSLHVKGPLNRLIAKLKLDLTATDLVVGKLLSKKADSPLVFSVTGQLEPNRLILDKANLNLGNRQLQIAGQLSRKDQGWEGALRLAPFSLESLQTISPVFEHFKIKGEVNGQMILGGVDNLTGQLELKGGGTHLTQLIGDLSHTEGIVRFDSEGLAFSNLRTLLGESPLKVRGNLSNWKKPQLRLHVTGKKVRAQDLIFNNRQMMLQDLDGRLLINADGIAFDPVHVTVEKKTTAIVTGQIHGYHNPRTTLEVSSEDADILDIIRLFSGPHKLSQAQSTHSKATLTLKARVKSGKLGSFYFENARGTINDHNNVFTLFPLNFDLGQGSAIGRVEFDRSRNNLLKISGHAKNCDADRVYEMLFEKSGIFRGTLSGDFYIEGEEIGEQFWKTSHGGGHLQIEKGAMRELKGFAQIFSLLNVSQLFKFRLPDMDKEGLPFSHLEASARMTEGVLSFDNFRITSPAINISAVGEIDTLQKTIDSTVGIKPLRTVDIILSRVPLFGWVLTGKEEALITALFTLKGPVENPKVAAAPASSVAKTALGIIGRALSLPFRLLRKTGELLTTPPRPGETPPPLEELDDY